MILYSVFHAIKYIIPLHQKKMSHSCQHNYDHSMTGDTHHCCGHDTVPSVCQTLEELDFERGIWYAAQNNEIPRVEKLLQQGTSADVQDSAGYCALHYASREGHLEMCRILLNSGASVNITTKAGRATALHRAASKGHEEIVKLLLKCGAVPDLQDADGKTALHRAVEGQHYSIAEILVNACGNLKYILDVRGRLPVHYLLEEDEKFLLLLK